MMQNIHWKLHEADFHLKAMQEQSDASLGKLRFADFSWANPQHFSAGQAFLFEFSAMLSTWRSVSYYMEETCKRTPDAEKWFKSLRDRQLLAAFSFLRDSDVHQETLKPGVRYAITMGEVPTQSQDFCLDSNALQRLPKFQKEPWAVGVLAEQPILPTAQAALRDLRKAVEEGLRVGHLP